MLTDRVQVDQVACIFSSALILCTEAERTLELVAIARLLAIGE